MSDKQNKTASKAALIGRIVLITLIIAGAALILINIFFKAAPENGMGPGGPPAGMNPGGISRPGERAGTEETVSVNAVKLQRQAIEEYIKTSGDVITRRSVNIYPDAAGKLARLYVSLGDYITVGQIIGEVDPSKPGSVYALNHVTSPIAGSITELPVDLGATVTTQTAVAVVGDLEDLLVQCYISERYVARIKVGQKTVFNLEAYPGVDFTATVAEKSPVLDRQTRTLEIRLKPEPMDKRIRAGMFASVKLITRRVENTIVVPEDCLIDADGQTWVFAVDQNNTAHKKAVKTGLVSDGMAEITDGLTEGEVVVTRGQNILSDGFAVNIVQ